MDGAVPIARFWYITLPLLKPTSFFVIMISMVAAVAGSQAFDIIWVMTGGGPANSTSVVIVYIYQQAFSFGAFAYSSCVNTICPCHVRSRRRRSSTAPAIGASTGA
jgi:multiple sugar transport system permease protein